MALRVSICHGVIPVDAPSDLWLALPIAPSTGTGYAEDIVYLHDPEARTKLTSVLWINRIAAALGAVVDLTRVSVARHAISAVSKLVDFAGHLDDDREVFASRAAATVGQDCDVLALAERVPSLDDDARKLFGDIRSFGAVVVANKAVA